MDGNGRAESAEPCSVSVPRQHTLPSGHSGVISRDGHGLQWAWGLGSVPPVGTWQNSANTGADGVIELHTAGTEAVGGIAGAVGGKLPPSPAN
jgi:hypothetical protein